MNPEVKQKLDEGNYLMWKVIEPWDFREKIKSKKIGMGGRFTFYIHAGSNVTDLLQKTVDAIHERLSGSLLFVDWDECLDKWAESVRKPYGAFSSTIIDYACISASWTDAIFHQIYPLDNGDSILLMSNQNFDYDYFLQCRENFRNWLQLRGKNEELEGEVH
jgi:hypothetical protein